jgi:hypothetical protein
MRFNQSHPDYISLGSLNMQVSLVFKTVFHIDAANFEIWFPRIICWRNLRRLAMPTFIIKWNVVDLFVVLTFSRVFEIVDLTSYFRDSMRKLGLHRLVFML